MLKHLKSEGFASMTEVIIAAIIFAIAAAGVFTLLSTFRVQGRQSTHRLEAAYVGKSVIENLRSSVSAENWNDPNSSLAVGSHQQAVGNFQIDYTLTDVPDLGVRRLTMNVTYPD